MTGNTTINSDYWRKYHDAGTVERGDALRQTFSITSTGVRIHMDVYEQPDKNAPVFIFNHGGGGYSRLFIPMGLAMFDLGYTVIFPDQRGQGLSEGDRGDYTVAQCLQNILDAARWARQRYTGPVFMGGGSLGGGLTYYAAAAGAPVNAVVLHNLYDFGNGKDGLAFTRVPVLSHVPGIPAISKLTMRLLTGLVPRLRISNRLLSPFENMVDPRAIGFYDLWSKDPYPIKTLSVRSIGSLMNTPPAVPFEKNTIPALVINQKRDRMVSPSVTRRNYERLGGPKQYMEIDYGHWAMGEAFIQEWTGIVHTYLSQFR
ncbi:MAG: hypothetical protein OHK0046_14940 [Anaerolineae bacterium]